MDKLAEFKNPSYELEIQEDGTVILPPNLLSALGLQIGDTITLIQGQDEVWFMPARLYVPEVAETINKLLTEKGMTIADLLAGLEEERERLFKERYGDLASG